MEKHWSVRTINNEKGVYTDKVFKKGENIWVGMNYYIRCIPHITEFGLMIKHSPQPTTKLVYSPKDKVYYVQAKRDLKKNEEITLNYKKTPWFVW